MDSGKVLEIFKEIILRSYGEKSPDGKHFYKSPEISAGFASTEAYSELFIELASNSEAAAKFINGVVPDVPQQAVEAAANGNLTQLTQQ